MFARVLLPVLLTGSIASTAASQTAASPAAVPVEPIAAIIDAFHSHSVVALPDAHGNEGRHAFLISLIRDPINEDFFRAVRSVNAVGLQGLTSAAYRG